MQDWVLLKGLSLIPDPQSAGDPKVTAKLDNKMKSEGSLEARDSMITSVAAEVVDIRPNGNLVLEARRRIRVDNEEWDYSLRGIIREQDVQPDNSVMSQNIAQLDIYRRNSGHVRDGYRRGWVLKFLDKWQLF